MRNRWGGLSIDPHAPGWGPEVSYFIHPSYQAQGFATELVTTALDQGFRVFGLPQISAFAKPPNKGSIRILEKCGFKFLRFEPALERNHYELTREDWTHRS